MSGDSGEAEPGTAHAVVLRAPPPLCRTQHQITQHAQVVLGTPLWLVAKTLRNLLTQGNASHADEKKNQSQRGKHAALDVVAERCCAPKE